MGIIGALSLGRPLGGRSLEVSAVSDTVEPPETIEVESEVVACDGGDGPLGHPRVFLNMEGRGEVDCPYCDRRYILKPGAVGGAGH